MKESEKSSLLDVHVHIHVHVQVRIVRYPKVRIVHVQKVYGT